MPELTTEPEGLSAPPYARETASTLHALRRALARVNGPGCIAIALVLGAWEVASGYLPAFLFPSLSTIAEALVTLLTSPAQLAAIVLTYLRILVSLVGTFLIATLIGISAANTPSIDRAVSPLIQLKQGIPGVCWAIFAIIWFDNSELRIGFVVLMSIFPSFYFQTRDGYRGIPKDLWEMVWSWRPSRWQMFRKFILPSLVPAMLTSWRINLGAGARVAVTAELLAGISGIGHQLRTAQEQFRMDTALAWTAVLATFILLADYGMARLERRLLSWRPRVNAP